MSESGDIVKAAARGVVDLLAGALSPTALLDLLRSPLGSRADEEIKAHSIRLSVLESRVGGFNPRKVGENPAFVSAIQHQIVIAMRTHQAEKIEALRNAVTNVAIGRAPPDDLQLLFLRYVDQFTPWHLRLLDFFANPSGYAERHGIVLPAPENAGQRQLSTASAADAMNTVFPDLADRRPLRDLICRELRDCGLFGSEIYASDSKRNIFKKRTTPMGDEFLAFVSRPPELPADVP